MRCLRLNKKIMDQTSSFFLFALELFYFIKYLLKRAILLLNLLIAEAVVGLTMNRTLNLPQCRVVIAATLGVDWSAW